MFFNYGPQYTLLLPVATLEPHATGSPILPASLPLTKTVGLPEANTELWQPLSGQQ